MLNKIDLSRIDLNLLVLFEAVREEGHVGRAADRLRLSPSAVSHGLGRLRRLLNDPLFVRAPKGVVPTDRALGLSEPIAEVLGRVRRLVASADPFDPATSTRRFIVGAPDGVSAVLLPPLLDQLARAAPGVDLGLRQVLPAQGDSDVERAWRGALVELDARAMDVAIIPTTDIPARFARRALYREDFVIVMRQGHVLAGGLTLDRYCEARHLVVSQAGDGHGFVDEALSRQGRARHVALTVPDFMFALAVVSGTDLVCALPRRFAARYAQRFGIVGVEAPLPLDSFLLTAVAPEAAMADAGLAWLFELLASSA